MRQLSYRDSNLIREDVIQIETTTMMAKYQIIFLKLEAMLEKIGKLLFERHFRYKAKGFYAITRFAETKRSAELDKYAETVKARLVITDFCRKTEGIWLKSKLYAFDMLRYRCVLKSIGDVKHLKARLILDRLRISSDKKSTNERLESLTLEKLAAQMSLGRPSSIFRKKSTLGSNFVGERMGAVADPRKVEQENELLELKIRMTEEYAQSFIDRVSGQLE